MLFGLQLNMLFVFFSLGGYQLYLLLTQRKMKPFSEGFIKYLQMFIGVPTAANLIFFMVDPFSRGEEFISIMPKLALLGFVIFNSAALMIVWCHISLGRFWSNDLGIRSDHQLVKTGLYRWVRHPLYTSFLVLTLGMFLMTGDWLITASVLAYFSAVAARTWKEEEMLVQHFGSEYVLYRSQTGRFLPRIVFAHLGVKLLAVRNT